MSISTTNRKPATSLFSRKQGLGIPIRVKNQFVIIHIDYYTSSVLNKILYTDSITLTIHAFLGLLPIGPLGVWSVGQNECHVSGA